MPRLRRSLLLGIVLSLLALSLAIAIKAASTDPECAFYTLPSRVWELLLGCLLGLVYAAPIAVWSRMFAEIVGAIGITVVVLSLVLLQIPHQCLASQPRRCAWEWQPLSLHLCSTIPHCGEYSLYPR